MTLGENLSSISALFGEFNPYTDIKQKLNGKATSIEVEGLPNSTKAPFIAQLQHDLVRPLLVVCASDDAARKLAEELSVYAAAGSSLTIPISTAETLVYTEGAPDYDSIGARIKAIHELLNGKPSITVASIHALLQKTLKPETMRSRVLTLEKGVTYDLTDIQRKLLRLGYERSEVVEQPGQWTRKGGIIDIFAVGSEHGIRLDFFGDDLESIRAFDTESQRSIENLENVLILPAREMPLQSEHRQAAIDELRSKISGRMVELREENLEGKGDEHALHLEERVENDLAQLASGAYFDQAEMYLTRLFPDYVCLLDYIGDDAVVIIDEPSSIHNHWEHESEEMAEIAQARCARGEWLEPGISTECLFDRFASF